LISELKFNIYVIFPRNIIFIKFLHYIVLFYAAASSLPHQHISLAYAKSPVKYVA